MFKQNTTIVVGAGASVSLDFPTGPQLVDGIRQKLNFQPNAFGGVDGDARLWGAIKSVCSSTQGNLKDYFTCAQDMHSGLGLALSIDQYIDTHSANPLVAKIAKLTIALFILDAEAKVRPSRADGTLPLRKQEIPPNYWVSTLCENHFQGFRSNNLEQLFSRLQLICFNYDRCVEQFLSIGIAKHFHLSDEDAIRLIETLSILHPYGHLGPLPLFGFQPAVPFGGVILEGTLREAAASINTFTEGPNTPSFASRMAEVLSWTKNLLFLGFGFAEINMKILGTASTTFEPKKVIGTAYNMPRPNVDHLDQMLPQLFHSPGAIPLRTDLKAEGLFGEYSMMLFS